MNKPDFICIGASKTGTTWLHKQFMCHKDIWVPFVKELHYFDHKEVKRWVHLIAKRSVFGRVVRSAIIKGVTQGELKWLYQYLFKERLPDHYYKLFEGRGERLTGEITPSYSSLPEEEIREIARIQPDCKIIYILREPAERTWSQLNMIHKRRGPNLKTNEIYARMNKRHVASSDYLNNLSNWKKYFPAQQIYIGFYDELKTDPKSFLNKIYEFLCVTLISESISDHSLNKTVNKGLYIDDSSKIPMELTKKYHHDLIELHQRFNNEYTEKWLVKSAEKIGGSS